MAFSLYINIKVGKSDIKCQTSRLAPVLGNCCSPGCRDNYGVLLFCHFYPQDVLDEIWDLTESVFEGFLPSLLYF